MNFKFLSATLALTVAVPGIALEPAMARTQTYQAGTSYHRVKCGSGNGAVGTVAGGAGGALIGHAVVGGPVGAIAGGVGGALLGRHLDKKHTANRNYARHGC